MASSLFIFWALFIYSKEKQQRNMVFVRFLQVYFALVLRNAFICDHIFYSGSCAYDANTIFLFYAIILLVVLATGFLLRWSFVFLRCSPLACRYPITALHSVVAAEFSLLALVLLASRYTLFKTLQPARLSLPDDRGKLSRNSIFFIPERAPAGARTLIGTSKPSSDKIWV